MKISNDVFHYISNVKKVSFFNNYVLLYSDNNVYLYQNKSYPEAAQWYSYFQEIDFHSYLKRINNFQDDFSLFMVEESSNSILDIMYDLYQKSSITKTFHSQQIENIYQKTSNRFENLFHHYFALQDRIEEMLYPSESYYYLLIHISEIYRLLSLGKFFLEQWLQIEPHSYQEVCCLHKILPNNIISGNIIDVSSCHRDSSIKELSYYYHCYYYQDSLIDDISLFISDFSMSNSETFLLYSYLSIIKEIDGSQLMDVKSLIYYVQKTYSFLLEKYQEYQKSNNNEFHEE